MLWFYWELWTQPTSNLSSLCTCSSGLLGYQIVLIIVLFHLHVCLCVFLVYICTYMCAEESLKEATMVTYAGCVLHSSHYLPGSVRAWGFVYKTVWRINSCCASTPSSLEIACTKNNSDLCWFCLVPCPLASIPHCIVDAKSRMNQNAFKWAVDERYLQRITVTAERKK